MLTRTVTEKIPKFYRSVTVGERGQVAIPAEARREMGIEPASKLLAFGGPDRRILLFIKLEEATEILADVTAALSQIQRVVQSDRPKEGRRTTTRSRRTAP